MFYYKKNLLLVVSVCLTSCYGYYSSGQFIDLRENKQPLTRLEVDNCLKSNTEVKLYFEGESINFEYERIGLVEVKGNSVSNDQDIITELKKEAKGVCCDAVIGIKKGYVQRKEGIYFVTDVKDETEYSAIVYSGVAVKRKI